MGDRPDQPAAPRPAAGRPLSLTLNPRLDAAVVQGWEAFDAALQATEAGQIAGWLAQRIGQPRMRGELQEAVEAFLGTDDPDERAVARAELAELVEGEDDLVADTLWEGVLAHARDTEDPELMVEAIAHLAEIAEANGDPLAAAEYHLEFLNWRRAAGRTSDPETVLDAFDEVVRLAHADGEQKAAAVFEYRQAAFARLAEAEDDRATEGDWERDGAPYESWA